MSKTQEQLDEELFASLLPTIDDMFDKIFPAKMFCEIDFIEDVVDEDDDGDEDEEEDDDQE